MNAACLILVTLLLAALQARLPAVPLLGGLRLEWLPALVAWGALTLRPSPALGLALFAGLTQDALSAGWFGLTGMMYASVAFGITQLRELLDRDWPWVQLAAGAAVAGAAAAAGAFVTGFAPLVLLKVIALAWWSALLTTVAFFAAEFYQHWGRNP